VLIVADDDEVRETVRSFLVAEGFHAYSMKSCKEALERLPGVPRPALILVDLMMQTMDGWGLVGALERDDRLATLPVVFVAVADPQSPGGYRHSRKPVALADLLPFVGEICLRRA
jgi:CheY-like chemotaxis protein